MTPPRTPAAEWYTAPEFAALLGLSLGTVYRWLHEGALCGVELNAALGRERKGTTGVWRIPKREVARLAQLAEVHADGL